MESAMSRGETKTVGTAPDTRPAELLIKQGVLAGLGSPRDLYGVKVLRLWDHCYRVNVLTGAEVTNTRIVASYFITADDLGNILQAEPAISKRF
jgi:hypothetical protein